MPLLEPRPAGRKLEHLTGLRFVLILWVVLFHLSGLQPGPASVASKSPLDAVATAAFEVSPKDGPPTVRYAVAGFIVMSGFVTQWSQGARSPGWGRGLALFYTKRLDRVLLTTWIGMALGQLIQALVGPRQSQLSAWHGALCYLQLAPWVSPIWPSGSIPAGLGLFTREVYAPFGVDQCPDPPSWTIAVLVFQWLLYPVITQRVVNKVAARGGAYGLAVLSLVALLLSFSSSLLLWSTREHDFGYLSKEVGDYLSKEGIDQLTVGGIGIREQLRRQRAVDWGYFHPLAWVAPFLFGASVAALADLHARPSPIFTQSTPDAGHAGRQSWLRNMWLLADACALCIVLLSTVPDIDLWLGVPRIYLLSASVGLFGGAFYGSAVGWTPGFFASRLSRSAPVALGTYAFEIYILHYPVMHVLIGITPTDISFGAELLFLGGVWWISAAYANYIQNPLVDRLRASVTAWEKRGRSPTSSAKPTKPGEAEAAEQGRAPQEKPGSHPAKVKGKADEWSPLQP